MWVNLEEYIILLSDTYNYFTSPGNLLRCLSDYFPEKWDIMQEKVKKIEHFEFSKKRAKIEFFQTTSIFSRQQFTP